MGNRFEHLEFEDHTPRSGRVASQFDQEGELSAAPMDQHAYHGRALEAFHRGEFDKALRYFTRVLELDRAYVPAWVGQVQMLIELDELREADMWADKALELFRNHGDLLSAKAVANARRSEKRTAVGLSDLAMKAQGSGSYRWLARGEVLLACGASHAGTCFERAKNEPDADWFTAVWAGRIFRTYDVHAQALIWARQGTEQAPDQPYAWYTRGLCERDLALASYRQSMERALQLDEHFAPARFALQARPKVSWLRRWLRRIRG